MYKHPRKRWTWMYDARPLWKYSERATTCQVHRQLTWRSLRAQQRTRHFQEHPVLTQAEVWDASYKMVKHKSPSWEIPEPTLSVLSMGGWVPVLGWDKWRWLSAGNELTLSLVEEARRSLEHQKKVTSKYSTASISPVQIKASVCMNILLLQSIDKYEETDEKKPRIFFTTKYRFWHCLAIFYFEMCIQTNLNLNENISYIWYIFSFEKTALIVTIQKCSNLPASDAVNNLRWHFDLQQLDSALEWK